MIKRSLSLKLTEMAKVFPAVGILGPRQSGKTTLAKAVFPKKPYVSLEEPNNRQFALKDPKGFLHNYPRGAIIDEIQRAPELFSYLQSILDEKNIPGMFILTGSQNFLLLENISQTLAGRIALLKLMPFSLEELGKAKITFKDYEQYLYTGSYPRIYDKHIEPQIWHSNYIQTYIERDLRMIKNIHDLSLFQTFLKMCAHQTGQLLNLSGLAVNCGITHNTAKAWLSILEASFIIFLLRPHYRNFKKRLVKMPKLYFYDTGLVCFLLEIHNIAQLNNHALKGGIFESMVISELIKYRYNTAKEPGFYFWRDKTGHEIDCLITEADNLIPIEIKSGRTATENYFKNIVYWNRIAKRADKRNIVIYGGSQEQTWQKGTITPWTMLFDVKKAIKYAL